MIRNIAATAVDTYLAGGGIASLTTAQLDAQRVALTAKLGPALTAMGLSGSIDLLRANFNADGTGLNRFMDVVKVDTTTPTAVTITNILDAASQLIIDTTHSATALASSGGVSTTGLAPSGMPLDGIRQTFDTIAGFFATGLPAHDTPGLVALFSSTFMNDGRSRDAFLTDITTDPINIGLRIVNIVLDSIDATGTIAQVHFRPLGAADVNLASGNPSDTEAWQMKKNNAGVWQLDGNRRIAGVFVNTFAHKSACNPASACTITYHTGLHFDVDGATLGIGSAVVTGLGLPAQGVTLVAQANRTWFNIPNSQSCGGCWDMTDNNIAQVTANSVYTVKLYNNTGTLMATYTEVVPVAPVLNTVAVSLVYPALTADGHRCLNPDAFLDHTRRVSGALAQRLCMAERVERGRGRWTRFGRHGSFGYSVARLDGAHQWFLDEWWLLDRRNGSIRW